MTYDLFIGTPAYSSWSLRAWLLLDRFGLPFRTIDVDFLADSVATQMAPYPPARTVPALRTPEGTIVWESLAIAEELASRHPEAVIWPKDPAARAIARSLAAEMHSGFAALRIECPMNLNHAYGNVSVTAEVDADLDRIAQIWAFARGCTGSDGPWLCGEYSAADAFFAPVAARIAGYGLAVPAPARAYVETHLNDPAFRRWRALALAQATVLPWYEHDFPHTDWPGPAPLPARVLPNGPSANATCPFSGKPVTHFAEIEGRVVGFCNATCRDKVVADAGAWPELATFNQI